MKNRKQIIQETVEQLIEMGPMAAAIRFRNLPRLQQLDAIKAKNAQLGTAFDTLHYIRALGKDVHPIFRAAQSDEALRRAARKLIQGERVLGRVDDEVVDAFYDPMIHGG